MGGDGRMCVWCGWGGGRSGCVGLSWSGWSGWPGWPGWAGLGGQSRGVWCGGREYVCLCVYADERDCVCEGEGEEGGRREGGRDEGRREEIGKVLPGTIVHTFVSIMAYRM